MGCLVAYRYSTQQACLSFDLAGALPEVFFVDLVEQKESFCVECLASDSFQGGDCCVSCLLCEGHGLFAESYWEFAVREKLFVESCTDSVQRVLNRVVSFGVVEGYQVAFWTPHRDCEMTFRCGVSMDCECVSSFHVVLSVKCLHFSRSENMGAVFTGAGVSSQVSPVRAPKALSRSGRRLDGSNGSGGTPAKAGDELAARFAA